MSIIQSAGAPPSGFYPREIDYGVLFNKAGNAHLGNFIPVSSAIARQKWIFSTWIKRGTIVNGALVSAVLSGNQWTQIIWYAGEQVMFYSFEGALNVGSMRSLPVQRDCMGWYHVVVALDTTQAVLLNRLRMWVNGIEITSKDPSGLDQNSQHYIGHNVEHRIGFGDGSTGTYLDGYTAETILLSGQTHADPPSLFGETKSGIWVPKQVLSGLTYGTSGFHLDYSNPANLGLDISGNGNNFTASGTGLIQVQDTPTNNFATLNSLSNLAGVTLAEGNLKATKGGNQLYQIHGTLPIRQKTYIEVKYAASPGGGGWHPRAGFVKHNSTDMDDMTSGGSPNRSVYRNFSSVNFTKDDGSSEADGMATYAVGDICMMAIDPTDNFKMWFGKNGNWNSGNPATGEGGHSWATPPADFVLFMGIFNHDTNTLTIQVNFGNPTFAIASGNADQNGYGNFEYAPPSGFLANCSANMDDPDIEDCSEGCYANSRAGAALTGGIFKSGDPTHVTSNPKFGTSAMYFDGDDSIWTTNDFPNDLGSGTFCVEFWVRFDALTDIYLFNKWAHLSNNREWNIYYDSATDKLRWYYSTDGTNSQYKESNVLGLAINTWYHIAIEREGNTLRFWLDGVPVGTADVTGVTVYGGSSVLFMASGNVGQGQTNYLTGYMDDIRISVGTHRYGGTSPFAPPGRFTSRDSYTKLLIQSIDEANGSSTFDDQTHITDVNFPVSSGAVVISKPRFHANEWRTFSTVRGAAKVIYLDREDQNEPTEADSLMGFLTNGYRLGSGNCNNAGYTFLELALRVGADYGLTIVQDTGTGIARNIAHGGGRIPSMIWAKNLIDFTGVHVYHSLAASNPETMAGVLGATALFNTDGGYWNNTAPDAVNFRVGINNVTNGNGDRMEYLCFFDIPGFCRAFSYIGNGATDGNGPFIPLDFRPKFWLYKRVAAVEPWIMQYTAHQGYNPIDERMDINDPGVESTGPTQIFDVLSNGLKLRTASYSNHVNATGALYIGFAWAEQPGRYSNAR